MELPESNDLVKEAGAPLADICKAEEPQTHSSTPHSSPPIGATGIDPTSHLEERMSERSEEEEGELVCKTKEKQGEIGQGSVECILNQV